MSRRNNKKKKKDFFPKPTPAAPATPPVEPSKPTPANPPKSEPVPPASRPLDKDTEGIYPSLNDASGPSVQQRAANQVAATLYASGVDPISSRSKSSVDDSVAPRETLVEVERRLLAYFAASFDTGSLKPSEAAQLGRSIATTITARRKLELAENEEKRRAESHPKNQNLKDLQAARLAKFVSKGRIYPPKNDPKEVSPESKGPPKGLDPTPDEAVDAGQLPPTNPSEGGFDE